MEQVNDLSFTIGGRVVVIIEHQSTINPNMAMRIFLYAARVYEKKIPGNKLYSYRTLKVPRPKFYVLYNGTEDFPDKVKLRLSDLFIEENEEDEDEEEEMSLLELTVPVYNINVGHNAELLERSKTLKGYSVFIDKAREYEALTHDRSTGIKSAVEWCVNHEILSTYLKDRGSEVINMLSTEWNTNDAKKVWQKEAFEDGIKIGEQRSAAVIAAKDAQLSAQAAKIAALEQQLAMK
jgi:hypothetical protein